MILLKLLIASQNLVCMAKCDLKFLISKFLLHLILKSHTDEGFLWPKRLMNVSFLRIYIYIFDASKFILTENA